MEAVYEISPEPGEGRLQVRNNNFTGIEEASVSISLNNIQLIVAASFIA